MAARELNDAKEFAKKHDILKAYGSYEELTKDPELGIIFMVIFSEAIFAYSITLANCNNVKFTLRYCLYWNNSPVPPRSDYDGIKSR